MGKVITFSLQKGGVGKSTTSTLTAFLLSQQGYKVLALDLDGQGNLTQIISDNDDLTVFQGQTILEGMKENNLRPYIRMVSETLHYIPTDDYLVLLEHHDGGDIPRNELLIAALVDVLDEYDYVIIDTPPNLGAQTLNALIASDYVVIMFETSKLAYNAIPRFMTTIQSVQETANANLKIAGILPTLSDARRSDNKELLELIKDDYPDLVFDTVISRRAAVGRIPVYGLYNNPEIKQATTQHAKFVKELIERVK